MLISEQGSLRLKHCSLLVGDKKAISFGYGAKSGSLGNKNLINLSSELFSSNDLASYEPSLEKILRPDKSLFRLATNPDQERPGIYFTELCWQVFRSTLSELAESFSLDALAHIDADRGAPRRYYFTDFANEENDQKTGFVSVLAEDENVRKAVSDWMERFSLKIEVKKLADTLHRLLVEERGLNLGLDITDVGFGISQVLPIIVKGFCAPPDSLTFIEQPEAHLHPKMQSELADLFLEMAGLASNRRNREPIRPSDGTIKRRFIIETHSEYLLKRLRLRIAQGLVQPDDVAIYFLSRSGEGATELSRTKVEGDGNFDWPAEFYATDLRDNIEFIKASLDRRAASPAMEVKG